MVVGAVVLVSAPSGAVTAVSQTITPPYSTGAANSITRAGHAGCSGINVTRAQFTLATGIGGFQARANASSCPKVAGGRTVNSFAYAAGQTYLTVPINSPSTGIAPAIIRVNATFATSTHSNLTVHWNCPAAHRNRTTGAGTSSCQASSQVDLNLSVVLLDLSTFAQTTPTNVVVGYSSSTTVYSDDFCYWYGCWWSNYSYTYSAGTLRGNLSWWINTSLTATDRYAIAVTISSTVSAMVTGFRSTHVEAGLDYGTGRKHWALTGISVT